MYLREDKLVQYTKMCERTRLWVWVCLYIDRRMPVYGSRCMYFRLQMSVVSRKKSHKIIGASDRFNLFSDNDQNTYTYIEGPKIWEITRASSAYPSRLFAGPMYIPSLAFPPLSPMTGHHTRVSTILRTGATSQRQHKAYKKRKKQYSQTIQKCTLAKEIKKWESRSAWRY